MPLPIPSSAALCVQPTASHQSTPANRLHQNLTGLSIIKEIKEQQQSLRPQTSWLARHEPQQEIHKLSNDQEYKSH
jgi:hypothetical protein